MKAGLARRRQGVQVPRVPPVTFRPMERSEEDLSRFKACFDRNGSPRTVEHLRWQYFDNPTGKLYVELAVPPEDASRLAGIYSVMPIRLWVEGAVTTGVQSLDTLTDQDFRGQGLFVKMAKRVFDRCASDHVACVYGFPNKNSAHGFFQRLEWQRLDPVPFLLKPLRANYALRRVKQLGEVASLLPSIPLTLGLRARLDRRADVRVIDRFGAEFDSLWSDFAARIPVAVHRDAEYLNWRLVDKPGHFYRRLAIYRGDQVVAFVAYDVQDKHGGRVGYILELLHRPGEAAAARRLLRLATRELYLSGAEVILSWCLEHSPNRSAFLREGFLPLPEKLRPIELHVGARALAQPQAPFGDRTRWYLSYLDSDTV